VLHSRVGSWLQTQKKFYNIGPRYSFCCVSLKLTETASLDRGYETTVLEICASHRDTVVSLTTAGDGTEATRFSDTLSTIVSEAVSAKSQVVLIFETWKQARAFWCRQAYKTFYNQNLHILL